MDLYNNVLNYFRLQFLLFTVLYALTRPYYNVNQKK